MAEKTIICPSCGAHFAATEPRCPYCGTMYVPAAEREYMEKLDTVVAGMCHCFFTLPPDIKAKMEDEKERDKILRQLNIW